MRKINKFLVFILIFTIFINSFTPLISHASGFEYNSNEWSTYDGKDLTSVIVDQVLNKGIHEGTADFYENFIRIATEYISWGIGQAGAVMTGDLYSISENNERLYADLKNITDNGKLSVNGELVTISKSFTDKSLEYLKQKTDSTCGYTLIKTVSKSSLSATMFPSVKQYNNMLKAFQYSSCNMVLFRQLKFEKSPTIDNSGINLYYAPLNFYIKGSNSLGNDMTNCMIVKDKDVYRFYNASGARTFDFYYSSITPNNSLNNDYFSQIAKASTFVLSPQFSGVNPLYYDKVGGAFYLVSSTGVSVPVFNTIDDMINYSVRNNLYYTGSNYTGEGKEITVNYTELNKLMSGYYNGMYDMLQQLIDKSGDSITPEQLQQLVDSVQSSFGMIKDTINDGFKVQETWLEKIYNKLTDIVNAINNGGGGGNNVNVDFSELNDSLTTVINKLDTINSKLNNIDTDDDNEKLTDIETAITDNKSVLNSIKTELTSQSVDIKEISTQLQSVADNLKDLSSDVDTINTELIDMSNQLDNISKSLNDLAVTLENIEKELKDTNGLLADIKDTLKAIKNWLVADTIFDGIDLISDLADFIKDFMSDIDTGITTISSGLSEVAETFTKKFPFSIPWDIVFLIEFLADTPATPVFELPLKFDSFGIDEIIKIDFTRFEVISKISRLLLTMLFTLGLAKFTYNIISVKQGDN